MLAGGRARRLDGISKPDLLLRGHRLLDHSLRATGTARRRVVVGPPELTLPLDVLRTQESPPHGGPVAGIDSGLGVLDRSRHHSSGADDLPVLVLACDIPHISSALPRLLAACCDGTDLPPDGAHLVDADGRAQWLAGVYRPAALRRALALLACDGGIRDASVRRLTAHLTLTAVPVEGSEAADVDTWADHAHLEALARAAAPVLHGVPTGDADHTFDSDFGW
ncbi:NTP transferase domain-containing protein [Raineyella fluvialis]|uniref:NTP transferase domain-containing protein n=1 Tax=Raineyella fluvialis TaxID=2662261 RepID=A0A5Q2FD54_9ACTN|nr:NTP transferase domain-containing protein [Raineyella fluvialis]